jgi:hypothetical protein
MNEITNSNGTVIKVGDWVEFKCDIEQCGQVESISRSRNIIGGYNFTLALTNEGRFSGDYIGGTTKTTIDANDIF